MDILSRFVGRYFDGARIIVRPSKRRSSRGEMAKSSTAARIVEKWLNAPTNKSTMSSLLFQCLRDGTGIGMFTATGLDLRKVYLSKFYARPVTGERPARKTS